MEQKKQQNDKDFDWFAYRRRGGRVLPYEEFLVLEEASRANYGRCFISGPVATYLGYWRACRFPVCRRARDCRAPNGPQYTDRYFPPCVHGDSEMRDAISGMAQRMEREPGLAEAVFGPDARQQG